MQLKCIIILISWVLLVSFLSSCHPHQNESELPVLFLPNHNITDGSEWIRGKMIMIKNIETFSEADSLLQAGGGEPLVWLDVYKSDSTILRKSGFIRSMTNGIIFYCDYIEKFKALHILHDYPNHYSHGNGLVMNLSEYEIRCGKRKH